MAVGLAVVSVGMAAYSAIEGANAKADAQKSEDAIKRQQADEVDYRADRNSRLITQEGDQTLSSEAAAYAGSGVELSGSALLAMEATQGKINQDVYETYHEARFRAAQLRQGANVGDQLASDQILAGDISGIGTILGGASKAYSTYQPSSGGKITPNFSNASNYDPLRTA